MADSWKDPDGEDTVPAAGPRRFDRQALQSTLADLVRSGDSTDSGSIGSPDATTDDRDVGLGPATGTAGHKALAALAVEVAQSTVTAPVGVAPADNQAVGAVDRLAGFPSAKPRAFSRPGGDPSAPAPHPQVSPAPVSGAPAISPGVGLAGPPFDEELPHLPSSPAGVVRLMPAGGPTAPRPPVTAILDDPAVPLRPRPLASALAAVVNQSQATASQATASQATALASPAGGLSDSSPATAAPVASWSPAEDDILPGRQQRRGRPFRWFH